MMDQEMERNYVRVISLGWTMRTQAKGSEYWWEAVRNDQTMRSPGFAGTFTGQSWLRDLDVILRSIKS